MRKFLIILFCCGLFACESKEEREAKKIELEEAQNKRIELAKYKKDSLMRADSLHQVFIKEQELIAFDNLNFGMSENEARKIKKSSYSIGEYNYFFYPSFYEDKLYFVELRTTDVTANYVDNKLNLQWENLKSTIKEKYGEPIESNGYPSFFSFEPGYVRFTDKWQIGNKSIVLYVGEESSGSTYYTGVWIYDKPSYEKKEASDKKVLESKTSKDANLF